MTANVPRILTPDEAADLLKVPRKTVVRLCAVGRLTARKVGRGWRIPESSIADYFAGPRPAQPIASVDDAPDSRPGLAALRARESEVRALRLARHLRGARRAPAGKAAQR